jgi:cobalamin biosynthesis Mg chelatase CobN
MKNLILPLILVTLLSSCRVFNKNLTRAREKEKTETKVTTVATQSATASSTTAATRTITEEIQDTAEVKGAVITATGTPKQLTGEGIKTETAAGTIEIRQDPVTGMITAKATTPDKRIPVNKKKTTIEQENTISQAASSATFNQVATSKTDKKINNKDLQVTKTPGTNYLAIGFISCLVLVLIVLLIIWWIRRKKDPPAAQNSV